MNNKIAVVFPGQGSQSVGMLTDLEEEYSVVRETFAEAGDVLGYDLWTMVKSGPAEVLDRTVHTQPALLAASVAIWRVLSAQEAFNPVMLAGHSLGEYSALVCAQSLAFSDAVKLVAARGQFMQDAVPAGTGAMAAIIGLDEITVNVLCEEVKAVPEEVIAPANFNSPGQIVVAGHKAAVDKVVRLAKEKGAKMAVPIPVSVPSHCELMRPAALRLVDVLQTTTFSIPRIPVINNADVRPYQTAEEIRSGLERQLFMPVRWVETIQYFTKSGITDVVECGPGKVLTGLNKRIDKALQLTTVNDAASLRAYITKNEVSDV